MEPHPDVPSTSVVPMRVRSARSNAAAAILMLLQLLFGGLVPAADGHAYASDTGSAAGVHIEKPGVHHPVHDANDCAFCLVLQAGATPASPVTAPDPTAATHVRQEAAPAQSHSPTPPASSHARAPPRL